MKPVKLAAGHYVFATEFGCTVEAKRKFAGDWRALRHGEWYGPYARLVDIQDAIESGEL